MNPNLPYGLWRPYTGSGALILAAGLFLIAGVLVYLGTRLHQSVGAAPPGKVLSILLVVIWDLSFDTFGVTLGTYMRAQNQQYGNITFPKNPITPISIVAGVLTFFLIAYLTKYYGLKIALPSAIIGAISALMIFELPFDLIVMWRINPPLPATQFMLLFFLPLFLVEITSFAVLTLLPSTRMSRYTLYSLAAMFIVFAIWALFGFSYPSSPLPFALNAVSKVLCFVAAITLFLPQKEIITQ